MQTFAQRALWSTFASFLIHLEGCYMSPVMISLDIPTTVGAMTWILSQYSSDNVDISAILATLPEFASSTARGTGRIWKDDGFEQAQRLFQKMMSLSASASHTSCGI